MVQTYIVDYLDSYFDTRVFPVQRFGNILKPNEQTFSRNFLDLNNSSNSIDYVLVYGVDIADNSCSIVIEYNNKKYLKQKHFIPMSNNYFVVLPGSERFFISRALFAVEATRAVIPVNAAAVPAVMAAPICLE